MNPDFRIVIGGTSAAIRGRFLQFDDALSEILAELSPILKHDHFLANAPFGLLNGIMIFGAENISIVEMGPISKRHNELPFTMSMNAVPLQKKDPSRK